MRRALLGVAIAIGLSGCGESSSPSGRESIIGLWHHDLDAAHPEIPSLVGYREDGSMVMDGASGSQPGIHEGRWSIDSRNLLQMTTSCGGQLPTCPLGNLTVNYQVTDLTLTWIFADDSQWQFHK